MISQLRHTATPWKIMAVNSHVALVDALEGLLAVADLGEIRDEATKDAIAAAVVALALANGEGAK